MDQIKRHTSMLLKVHGQIQGVNFFTKTYISHFCKIIGKSTVLKPRSLLKEMYLPNGTRRVFQSFAKTPDPIFSHGPY